MKLIDDRGNLFGAVNVIDALVVLLVVAVAVAGVALLTGGETQNPEQTQEQPDPSPELSSTAATVEVVGVQPYVADALAIGPVETDGIVAIENKSVAPTTVVTEDESGELSEREHPQKRTVTLQVTLETTAQGNETVYGEKPLEIGRTATFDFGDVTVEGTVTAFDDPE